MKVIASFATTGTRDESLAMAVKSIENQVDGVYIYDNSIEDDDLTDNGKFAALVYYSEPIYMAFCDDDIIYPPDYIEKSIEAIEKFKCIVTWHGRRLKGLNKDYYTGHATLNCLFNHPQTHEIDVAGTGVTIIRTDIFDPVGIHLAEDKRMSDLVFSLEAAKQGVPIMHIGHKHHWIRNIEQPKGTTIYETERLNCTRQNEIANEIYKIKYL